MTELKHVDTQNITTILAIQDAFGYVESQPISSTLEVKLRPEFSFDETNLRDVALQLAMQLSLMGDNKAISIMRQSQTPLTDLNIIIKNIATEAKIEEQLKALKKLKKLARALARLLHVDPTTIASIAPKKTTTPEIRTKRKLHKSRINKFSLVISLIVGLGEGLMAAVFASTLLVAWPFVLVLLAVGIPAALCNYFLFRGASFSVLKEIRFKKLSDSPLTRRLKNFSTLFSSAAGLSYGFISFSTALMAFGHLLFGLTMIAALATPPVALIILAAVVAVVTTIAIATLYDHSIRGLISKFNLEKLKEDFFGFIKLKEFKALTTLSEKCGHVAMVVARIMLRVLFNIPALVLCALVVVPVTLLARNHMAAIFQTTFRVSNALSNTLATVITVAMGAVVNGYFYASSVLLTANLLKKAVAAVLHPIDTFFQIKESCAAFFKQNNQQKTANVFNGAKRAAFFGCVTINGSAQGMGIASVVSPRDHLLHDAVQFAGGAASSGANGNAGANAMKGVASVVSKSELVAISKNSTSFFNSIPRKHVDETEFCGIALKS